MHTEIVKLVMCCQYLHFRYERYWRASKSLYRLRINLHIKHYISKVQICLWISAKRSWMHIIKWLSAIISIADSSHWLRRNHSLRSIVNGMNLLIWVHCSLMQQMWPFRKRTTSEEEVRVFAAWPHIQILKATYLILSNDFEDPLKETEFFGYE